MGLAQQLENMSPREQKLLAGLAAVFAGLLLIALPGYLYSELSSARDENGEIKQLLRRMNRAGELLAKRKSERDALERRYAKPAPALASFIEAAAKANGLEVPDTTDRPVLMSKGYSERVTGVKMRKVHLKPLVKMLEKLERAGHPVAISQLGIRARATGPDLYDISLAVSAYEKQDAAEAGKAAKGKAGKSKASKSKSKGKGT